MRKLCIEGVASHGGPESCVGVPRGRSEALIGVRAGRAIEPRNQSDRGADAVQEVEGNTVNGVMRESLAGSAWSENQGMCVSLHAREPGDPMSCPSGDVRAGRSGNAEAVILG
jgi:RNA-directed DNA polymerase